ncbi:HRDC domain-containing protein [Tessaracoccus oleiagri]|uniref:Ribonuclease D n=1 Tax=Tessaracoccus oleiagri TaxID=686624 RepID=A0A1G9MLN7_9ACTN|nr:HRDC domain-containing protein [Tessaracoccus oleiagri]SDL74565.1 ribonuclease D [Tessaracoccus oleiagri]
MSLVDESREPLRPVVEDESGLSACLDALRRAEGPVAFDAERAHGYRYWPRAYLFQLRREGAGTWLIDPTRFDREQLGRLVTAAGEAEWVIHAASQDLPSMYEAGVVPARIFDTELAARLMGKPGVSLGALLSAELGVELRKAHSAVNWATRPLKPSWLTYAALDVDFLLELRDVLDGQLRDMGRSDWAEQEFAWELEQFARTPDPRPEPWRRLSRVASIRTTRGLALARELWQERDAIAQRRDRPPGHILPDAAIVDAGMLAGSGFPDRGALLGIPGFSRPPGSRYLQNWLNGLNRASELPESRYPSKRPPSHGGVPSPKNWDQLRPEAAERWALARPALDDLACEIGLQPSLLTPPAALQRVLWAHERPTETVLEHAGMRPWQAELVAALLDEVLGD